MTLQTRQALLADTDSTTQQLCSRALEEAGFVVETVDSGIGAVTAARAKLPDLIVMNRQLRDVPAHEAVKWLRSNEDLRATPVIILGGKIEGDGIASESGSTIVLPKPITASRLRHAIDEAERSRGRVATGNRQNRQISAP